ncbi:MAG TPA: type II toxin-antitoxin system Phd/YefM family antitoxin [Candidatus Xenobia bacterium]|jgi:prevent-host-death family protein
MSQERRVSIAEAKNRLPSLVHEAEQGTSVELTRRGKPVAILLSWDAYQRLASHHASLNVYDAVMRWRKEAKVEELDINPDEIFVRDQSSGREFNWE